MEKREDKPPPYKDTRPPTYDDAVSSLSALQYPTSDEIVIHLRLLHIFDRVKSDIQTRDGLYGIYNDCSVSRAARTKAQRAAIQSMIARKRWDLYVARAIDRFELWWKGVRHFLGTGYLKLGDLEEHETSPEYKVDYSSSNEKFPLEHALPPIGMSASAASNS